MTKGIEEKVFEMIKLLNSEELPESNLSCENCAYAHQRIITEKNTSDQKAKSLSDLCLSRRL
jgi:hypothetical protein